MRNQDITTKPDISIFASAHRPQNWVALYKSIGVNDIKFEVVFVGPNPPKYELPENFRFIRSFVKPAQCAEIALRNTTADLVMNMADDCEFNTSRPLDRLYSFYKSGNSDKLIVSSRLRTNGKNVSDLEYRFFSGDASTPVMDLSGLMSKKLYCELGGIDRNFIAIMWSLDIAMRVYALGGKVVLSDVYINEDKNKKAGSNLCDEFWRYDRTLLDRLWTTNGKVNLNRKKIVEPFSDMNILVASQGPRGRWRGSSDIIIEKVDDCVAKGKSIFWMWGIKGPCACFNYAKRILLRKK